MEQNQKYFRCLMLFYFRKGKNATQAKRKIWSIYGENAVSERVCQNWFAKFRSGDTSCEDLERSGRPSIVDEDQLKTLVENNQHLTTREMAERISVSQKTVVNNLRRLGYVCRYDIWVPHELSERNIMDRISICDSLLKRNNVVPFLKRMITGDEKWIVYDNVKRKRSYGKRDEPPQTTPKQNIHAQKIMLCVWWDFKGIVYYELLPQNQTINSERYCAQLDRLKAAIDEKRPELANRYGVIFHQDNARPHVSLTTRQKLLEFGWDVLPHPPYSPDLAPSDFHLFRSLQNSLNGKKSFLWMPAKRTLSSFSFRKLGNSGRMAF